MDRDKFEEMLADYLGGELSPEQCLAFERHLAASDADRAEVEELRETLLHLRELPPPPAGYAPTSREAAPVILRYVQRALAYAALLLIGVGIGWLAKPLPAEVNQADAPAPARTFPSPPTNWPTGQTPSRLVLNAKALSVAFSQPADLGG